MHLDSNPSVQSNLSRTEQNVNCEHMEQMQIFMFAIIRENHLTVQKSKHASKSMRFGHVASQNANICGAVRTRIYVVPS